MNSSVFAWSMCDGELSTKRRGSSTVAYGRMWGEKRRAAADMWRVGADYYDNVKAIVFSSWHVIVMVCC